MFQTSLDTPVGILMIEGTRDFVTSIQFASARPQGSKSCALLSKVRTQLREYFAGKRMVFDLTSNLSMGTPFQRSVWTQTMKIAYGETTTYAELARRVGRPTAQRAVGRAVASNPLMILIPCHRVLSAKGKLSGYRGGLEAKEWLLKHESAVLM
ncbi:MAG: methylated-DNA--[protein]-cysteine S-methyltransferase [Chloroflexi bacterium]|nr:methylated-DNA--[protein]-cysteine S-methyltransferase [Chloroflexota bacterium]MCL5273320.1 methylated-DNA--[protein]-cysteine S-methyltransferase [Chloroflexota bacterium]